jgi:uncharacterized protein YrrD
MINLSDLLGQDAVSLRTAAKTGTVKSIAIEGNRVVAVELTHMTIPARAVRSFEGDVLTYDDNVASRTDSSPMPSRDPRGSLVLDMHGDGVGTIHDLAIAADGTIETIILDDGSSLPGSRLRAVGSFAAILSNDLPPPTGQPVA